VRNLLTEKGLNVEELDGNGKASREEADALLETERYALGLE